MELQFLTVRTRQATGKGAARRIRAHGEAPGVLYGGQADPVHLHVDLRQFGLLVHHSRGGEHAIVRLEVEDQPTLNTPALVKAVQHDPVRGTIQHVDFLRIRLDERIATVVPIRLEGHAVGITEGGVLDHQLRELEIECLALEVPEEIVVDVSGLHINDSIHVAQLRVPENVRVLSDPERPVVAVHPPRVIKEAVTVEAGAEAAEGEAPAPEVITERKEKEEDKDKEKEKDREKKK
jgi:large subunit ribosomal protein L25